MRKRARAAVGSEIGDQWLVQINPWSIQNVPMNEPCLGPVFLGGHPKPASRSARRGLTTAGQHRSGFEFAETGAQRGSQKGSAPLRLPGSSPDVFLRDLRTPTPADVAPNPLAGDRSNRGAVEARDALGERRLGQVDGVGGFLQRRVRGDRDEVSDVPEVDHRRTLP
jgi:hypothetical protein